MAACRPCVTPVRRAKEDFVAKIAYVEADGIVETVDVPDGWSLMQGAVANGVCGGSCSCGACHSYVDEARAGKLPARSIDDLDVLDHVAAEQRPNSRLARQIKSAPLTEGLILRLPLQQE